MRSAALTSWADHFDGTLEDVFELQDRVAISVAGIIEPALQGAEMRWSAQQRPTDDLTAYDLYLRALTPIRSGEVSRESYVKSTMPARTATRHCD
jgi:hypothetical protein